ncbi:uncharacterized protein PGTG_09650 [Puccinia graminis f. sp. tritici CRL 75-36-700-3]|uniref:Uncharacterized protein n=1 Tax=Puccinia graminis f. sp. tritici (strain CRL 75-36-700-3 / race SCCL) TaxID=418459 RepID=E3KI12_PUCGT|nr:uncharacterized protein PGTG_09650 [Puccinia graminis f. sp. tritici CRL 75-36-700-3]EFP83937.2 hypothetical protein PGTG_09650 [Puccinia graminis f. sp. tritici CRL 75-36-700-3]
MDMSNFSWDHFGSTNLSTLFTDQNGLGWTEGIRLELDPNGIDMFRRLVHYKIHKTEVISESEKGRVVKADLLDTPNIHSMIVKCSTKCQHPSLSHLPFPIYQARSYAAAHQFLVLFTNSVLTSSVAASDLKNLAQNLRIAQAFPINSGLEPGHTLGAMVSH